LPRRLNTLRAERVETEGEGREGGAVEGRARSRETRRGVWVHTHVHMKNLHRERMRRRGKNKDQGNEEHGVKRAKEKREER